MRCTSLIVGILAIVATYPMMSSANSLTDSTTQLVVVLSDSWDAPNAKLYRLDRTAAGWKRTAGPADVVLGSNGLAWGRGLHDTAGPGPVKREGDRKAPAGMFRLLNAMGYDRTPPAGASYPYVPIEQGMHCVDDPASGYYNRIVRESDLPAPAASLWTSSEILLRKDILYKRLIVVDHNVSKPLSGAGSCIFLHIWRGSDKGTAGCTAMKETDLVALITWLKESASPILVQLPRPLYETAWKEWKLPDPGTFIRGR